MRLYASIYVLAYILLMIVAFTATLYSETAMTVVETSLSELGAQQTKGNWIINTAFAAMSMATLIYGSYALKRHWMPLIVLYFFGISFGMTAIYPLAGMDEALHYNYTHDALHHLFSILSGFGFVLLCISLFFKIQDDMHILQTTLVLGIAIIFSILPMTFPEYNGLFQRFLFLICFGWLFYALTSYNFEKKDTPYFDKKKEYKKLKKHLFKDEK